MNNNARQQKAKPFKGCRLSIQLNGLNVLTISESRIIKEVLSFVAQKDRKNKETQKWKH